jgi:hypothetical protein
MTATAARVVDQEKKEVRRGTRPDIRMAVHAARVQVFREDSMAVLRKGDEYSML